MPPRARPPLPTPAIWVTGLFEPCRVKDAGSFCCVQHCCCQPCVVAAALREGGFRDADAIGLGLCLGGQGLLDEVAGYFARRKVVERYDIAEGRVASCVTSCCCAPLSNVQLVNQIAVREGLAYECASMRKVPVPPKRAPPLHSRSMTRR